MSGYVRLHRTLIGHPAFRNDAEAMAFAWMVMRAAWKPARVRYKGKSINLQRGQLAISVRDFADALDRDKNWVSRILQRMRDEDMIGTDAGTGVLIVTISNYDKYQADGPEFETPLGTRQGTDAGQTRDTEQGREEGKKKEVRDASHHVPTSPDPLPEVMDCWNLHAAQVGWPLVRASSKARAAAVRGRVRAVGLDAVKAAIVRARSSPYLGRDPPEWFTFDWMVKEANFLKLIEGNYDREANRGSNGRGYGPAPDPTLELCRRSTQAAAASEDGGDYFAPWPALPSGQYGRS